MDSGRRPYLNDHKHTFNRDVPYTKPKRSNDIVDDIIDIAATSMIIDSLFDSPGSSDSSFSDSSSNDVDFGGGDFGGGGAGDDW